MAYRFAPWAVRVPSHDDLLGVLRFSIVKVHYTFDKESKVNCLARYPHTIQVQTVPIDESRSIGIVDLRTCIIAVTECSPELAGQDGDYTIYALDYSEPDEPLVGQGMLSWALDAPNPNDEAKQVTGRVTKNLLGVFGKGNKETLEVRLKLSVASKVVRPEPQHSQPPRMGSNAPESALTPTGAAEWNSFMQMNPQIGQQQQANRVASPANSYRGPPPNAPNMMARRDSFNMSSEPIMQVQPLREVNRVAPTAVMEHRESLPPVAIPAAPSRPSSRASNKSTRTRTRKPPTGRPRGRPKKKTNEGNTSGYEDGTEGEDGPPTKKRAKVTQVEGSTATSNTFVAGMESSLRVTASTSSSLRNFRPVNMNLNLEGGPGNHLQEIPRAPTPVPNPLKAGPGNAGNRNRILPRRESTMSQEFIPNTSNDVRSNFTPTFDDGRSPDSIAQTPAFSEDSPGEMRSSPPVPRTTQFMRSSPPPSSPILPPMPTTHAPILPRDASFMTDDMDLFGESMEPLPTNLYSVEGVFQEQVFRLNPGPEGQDPSRSGLLNTPVPTSTPALPMDESMEASLPTLKVDNGKPKAPAKRSWLKRKESEGRNSNKQPQPTAALTPPLTTDAAEKPISPQVIDLEKQVDGADGAAGLTPSPQLPGQQQTSPQPGESFITTEFIPAKPASEPPTPARPSKDDTTQVNLNRKRQLSRSQSTGVLVLPGIPASEPAGPSALALQVNANEDEDIVEQVSSLRKALSTSLMLPLPLPASEPAGPTGEMESDAIPVPTSPPKFNKNKVKKQAIKQRLEDAISNGEMPPFCTNCGAVETPTWRKTYVQDHEGVPEHMELSAERGRITAIQILKKEDDVPTAYRLVKKSLGPDDSKQEWHEMLVCNPCGIWLVKAKEHRPSERWDKDADRLGQERKRGGSRRRSRKKKNAIEATSEAYLPTDFPTDFLTDALEANAPLSPKEEQEQEPSQSRSETIEGSGQEPTKTPPRGDKSDDQLGTTKRLLFPSPRKEGEMKILGDLSVNIVHTPSKRVKLGQLDQEKEKFRSMSDKTAESSDSLGMQDLEAMALLKTPNRERATTPPPKASTLAEPFKTPTRPTPSHRPITRSVTRSRRSDRNLFSPRQSDMPPPTPSKTPGFGSVRRSPRNHHGSGIGLFETPLSRQISQLIDDNPHFPINDWSDAVDGTDELHHLEGAALDASDLHGFSDMHDLNNEQLWSDVGDWQGSWE